MVDHCSSLGKTGRLAKEKAKGRPMLATIATIRDTILIIFTITATIYVINEMI